MAEDLTSIFGIVWLCVNVPLFSFTVYGLWRWRDYYPLRSQNAMVLLVLLSAVFTLGVCLLPLFRSLGSFGGDL